MDKNKATKVFDWLWDCNSRFVINKGGTASSKSVSSAQKEVLKCVKMGKRVLVIRKVASTLKDSVIPSFKARIKELGWEECFKENKSDRTLYNECTASAIIFRGLDDAEKMKSIEGIDRILVEEATELSLEDFFELNRRVRGREEIQITLNFNPVDERHWLKKHFFDQEAGDCCIVESTYLDNPFLTEKDREQIDRMRQYNYNQYRIYALGEWGIAEVDNPWLYAFDREKHVSLLPLKADNRSTVHLSFDFNINPMTCIAAQHTRYYGEGSYIKILKEFELRNTTVKEACKMIKSAFPHNVLTVTGDATGRNRNAGYSSGNDSLWAQVKRGLGLASSQVLVPGVNPSHKNNRFLCNLLLQQHDNFLIDPSCKGLINDCLTARPIETNDQSKEDQLMKGAGDSAMGLNLLDCMRYYLQTHHEKFVGS